MCELYQLVSVGVNCRDVGCWRFAFAKVPRGLKAASVSAIFGFLVLLVYAQGLMLLRESVEFKSLLPPGPPVYYLTPFSMEKKRTYARMPLARRNEILAKWRGGWRVSEIADTLDTYHQHVSWVIRSSQPSFEDFRQHDHFRRLRENP